MEERSGERKMEVAVVAQTLLERMLEVQGSARAVHASSLGSIHTLDSGEDKCEV